MTKLSPFILAISCLLSCQIPVEEQVVGNWVDTNFKNYTQTLKGRSEKFVIDTVSLTFLKGGSLVAGTDTIDLVFEEDGFAYEAESYKTRQPEDEWYSIRVLDVTDTTLTMVFFWFRDTLNLKKINNDNSSSPFTTHMK